MYSFPANYEQRHTLASGDINFNEAWLSELCDLKHLRPELTAKMAAAGFTRITFGLESASENVLTKMHKKLDLDLARENIVAATRNGLSIHVSSIINFPGEQTADAFCTLLEIAEKTTDRAKQESIGAVRNFVLFLYVRGIARITLKRPV